MRKKDQITTQTLTVPFTLRQLQKFLPAESETWFKRNPVGISKLQMMMKRMAAGAVKKKKKCQIRAPENFCFKN